MSSLIAPSPSGLLHNGASSHPVTIACVVIANALIILIIYLIFFFWNRDKQSVGAEAFGDSMSTNSSPCSSPRASRVQENDLSFLPKFVHTATDGEAKKECAVCITEFVDGQIGRLLPACGHKFHRECVDTWFMKHSTCPICRMIVKENKEGEKICLEV
ncbi:RING-H2 finger protein ATL2 [Rhynchospora pubera]|uniref:RING-H2 finger protein ATL2 n=1 Tax=Rhynchospora pubera TaxID=906938 RepID=A0AAV8HVZ5_9POAL|nr:RING-H2 finger protein ATL2 [Rhynchospora pubera]